MPIRHIIERPITFVEREAGKLKNVARMKGNKTPAADFLDPELGFIARAEKKVTANIRPGPNRRARGRLQAKKGQVHLKIGQKRGARGAMSRAMGRAWGWPWPNGPRAGPGGPLRSPRGKGQ